MSSRALARQTDDLSSEEVALTSQELGLSSSAATTDAPGQRWRATWKLLLATAAVVAIAVSAAPLVLRRGGVEQHRSDVKAIVGMQDQGDDVSEGTVTAESPQTWSGKGCSNWAQILLLETTATSDAECTQKCSDTPGCQLDNFQREDDNGDGTGTTRGACYLFAGKCEMMDNSHWNLHGNADFVATDVNFPHSTTAAPADVGALMAASGTLDDRCDPGNHPVSSSDGASGHGATECRYLPSASDLEHFRSHPVDIAILIPSNSEEERANMWDENSHGLPPAKHGMIAWRKYARYHGYAFYSGMPFNSEADCPGLPSRHPAWTKPCMALQLIDKHDFLIVVDQDTVVLRPRLRLEPLFSLASLLDASTGKAVALAEEWASCDGGARLPGSGDVNTGVVLFRRSPLARQVLDAWWNGPPGCDQGADSGVCRDWAAGAHEWSFDQRALHASLMASPALKDATMVLRSGCPLNSPFGDFVAHLVSGSPTESYLAKDRGWLASALTECSVRLLDGQPWLGVCREGCSQASGCSNWQEVLIRSVAGVTLAECSEECGSDANCTEYNYQSHSCLADSGSEMGEKCYLYLGGCDREYNPCWDLHASPSEVAREATGSQEQFEDSEYHARCSLCDVSDRC